MRNPYYERLIAFVGSLHDQHHLFICPNIKKYKGSPAVFEYWKEPSTWLYAIYVYEELDSEDSDKFQVIGGFDCPPNKISEVSELLQAAIDQGIYEKKKKDDKGTGTTDS